MTAILESNGLEAIIECLVCKQTFWIDRDDAVKGSAACPHCGATRLFTPPELAEFRALEDEFSGPLPEPVDTPVLAGDMSRSPIIIMPPDGGRVVPSVSHSNSGVAGGAGVKKKGGVAREQHEKQREPHCAGRPRKWRNKRDRIALGYDKKFPPTVRRLTIFL